MKMVIDDVSCDCEISLVPDSLGFKVPVLDIKCKGSSDIDTDTFVEYNHGKLKTLFSIDMLVDLRRKDAMTLTGFVTGRDELVQAAQHDYPFTFSLKDDSVHSITPPKQYIGFSSMALENIKGYTLSPGNKRKAYIIPKNTELTVDTLYRIQKTVRLIVKDSVIVYTGTDGLSDKLQHNVAG